MLCDRCVTEGWVTLSNCTNRNNITISGLEWNARTSYIIFQFPCWNEYCFIRYLLVQHADVRIIPNVNCDNRVLPKSILKIHRI